MPGPGDEAGEAALWARWRALAAAWGAGRVPEPDALLLAAYAEGRLDEAAAASVEDWLAEEPERIADVAAARAAISAPPAVAPEGLVARAAALVGPVDPQIVPFRYPTQRAAGWRSVAAWGGLAASILATSLIGFALGNDAYVTLAGGSAGESAVQDLFEPPGSGILPTMEEDSSL
ncbi:MAG TPA: hypothetical protein VN832_07840 [Stellaceae bacterium]|nr:hypothetical protein [Stellaceae bacterium]